MLLAVLDLAGVYFNVRMLLSSLKNSENRAFLQKYKTLVICQFVFQVSVLAMNSIEVWSGLDVQHAESCNVFKTMLICINIFLVNNFVAVLIIAAYYPIMYKNQEVSPKLLMLGLVCLGFICSAILWWCSCSSLHEFESQVITIIVVVVFLPLLLVAWTKYTQLDQTSEKPGLTFLWDTCSENKKVCFVVAWLVICCGTAIGLTNLRWLSFEEFVVKMICLLMMNSVVGIGLPVAFKELFVTIGEDEREKKTVVIQ